MKMHKTLRLILLLIILPSAESSFSQIWMKTFSHNVYNVFGYQLLEAIDHGILIGGNLTQFSHFYNPIIDAGFKPL